ncbi:nuclear polyadenylated RNA-binding protein 4 [[Candida] jaroonii]|uniref:Nuclear polyadenylated RNA-binding protein 4 n=1 Tax=[Candida] jaroonii TaxID=467808 RepID=A0ACA9Y6E3_9ASCO|nr:nuclear polyadenylated RNA-binding protein 4 [[Candida] jaroonii]
MSSFDDDEALFEDIYGDEPEVKEETSTKEEKVEEKSTTSDEQQPSTVPSTTEVTGETTEPTKAPEVSTESNVTPTTSAPTFPGMPPMPNIPGMPPMPNLPGMPPMPQALPPSQMGKSSGKMFIGGLNWDTTEQNLIDYFGKYGEIIDHTIMRDSASGRSRGFGFLTFADPRAVDEVLKQDHILDGKLIDPKRAIARDEQDKVGKIFVGGIDPLVNERDFNEFFSQFGHIVDCQLMIDKDTGRSRGFGFITYDSPEAVDKVCVNKYLSMNGKPMEVKRAEPRNQHQQTQQLLQQQQQQQQQMMAYMQQMQQMQAQMTPEQITAWQQYYQQYQQGGGDASQVDGGEEPGQPLNPQQLNEDGESEDKPRAPLPPPSHPPPRSYNDDYGRYGGGRGRGRGRGNYRGGYNSGYRRDDRGPRNGPPSGPAGAPSGPRGSRGGYGRGGYGRGGGGYHPYNGNGRGGRR